MGRIVRNLVLVALVLAFFGWSAMPPNEKLRLGKDLRGGVTLVYSVQIDSSENASETLNKTIDVLKRRVDPNGLMEIAMVPMGRDRIEITMPLPSERVEELKAAYEGELETLREHELTEDKFELIMRMDASERSASINRASGDNPARAEALRAAATAYDEASQARSAYEAALATAGDNDALDAMVDRVAEAELLYEDARASVLSASVTAAEVRRVLQLSSIERSKKDNETGETVVIESPRDRAWARLLERAPDLQTDLERVEAAFESYELDRRTLDDPADLIRLLQGAGVLTFRITADPGVHPEQDRLLEELAEFGPKLSRAKDVAWYKINQIENWYESVQELRFLQEAPTEFFTGRGYVVGEFDGEYYMLCWDARGERLTPAEGNWSVTNSFAGVDQIGRPAINFLMDPRGGVLLGRLTDAHVGDRMAVLLDDEVYTAPNLNSKITTNGQIAGDFSQAEIAYIIQVLNAGSLQAKLSPAPISQSTVGPELGEDNLRAGLQAGMWALMIVSVFMVLYYFLGGGVAVLSLACNALLILGAMSLNRAAFTLPGIAGVILTFGMAVDANVLIYERIREEIRGGLELRKAVRLGYNKALSSIVDGNITNLIVCVVLAYTGTQEIKGFAITLGIGVVATLFSALVVSRLLVGLLVEGAGIRRLPMLPTVVPLIERLLEPKINWLKLRPLFMLISIAYVTLGIVMIVSRGGKMLDTEFLGGVQVTLNFTDTEGDPKLATRADVQERVQSIAEGIDEASPLRSLRDAEVLPQNPRADGISSDVFVIKTVREGEGDVQQQIVDALLAEFSDMISSEPPIQFAGIGEQTPRNFVFPITKQAATLGDVIQRPQYRNDISDSIGGVAVVLEGMSPAPTQDDLIERLRTMRDQQDYSDTIARSVDVVILEGSAEAVLSAAVVVADETISFIDDPDLWETELARREWSLVNESLGRSTTPASVQSFSSAIAETFKAQAIVAVGLSFLLIMIYIWVRFGSVRYSMAAVITLVHDVLTALGLIALAEIVYEMPALQSIVQPLGIRPFKIDLNMIAAILTIIGYSLNDTIVIMDRIRENRGKLTYTTDAVINLSINQTISRTVITSGTTLIATMVLYVLGGEGVRAFAYTLTIGVVVGTYSSIAVAAPLVWSGRRETPESPAGSSAAGDTDEGGSLLPAGTPGV